jgi:hypothetical protein
MKSRRIRLAGHIASMKHEKGILVGKTEGKRPVERTRIE